MKSLLISSVCFLCLGALPLATANASTIQLGINGDAQVGANFINFGQYPNGAPYSPPPGYGAFEVSLVSPGPFLSAGVTPGEFGSIQSLINQAGAVTSPGPFMTFNAGGSNLQLWATYLPAGSVGAYTLTDTPNGAVASMNVDGYIWDTHLGAKVETFTGTFSATFNGETVADLLSGPPESTPFSATLTAIAVPGVPEPATWAMMILGAALIGFAARRRREGAPIIA